MRKSSFFYPLLLLGCWTVLMGAGTYALLETSLRQQMALNYARTRGKILQSQVGHSVLLRRGVEILYNYTVNDVEYNGHRFRYDDHNAALRWDTTVEEHPRGAVEIVYYNSKDPSDSLLQPGVDGEDLLLLLFSLPLNIVTLALWCGLLAQVWERFRVPEAGGVKILRRRGETCVPLAETSPLAAGFYGMAAVAFVASFPVVISGGFQPSLQLMKTAWAIVVAAGVAAFAWRFLKTSSGIYDLRISPSDQTITLPQTAGRHQPLSVSSVEISGVSVQRRITKNPSGTHFSYVPVLERNGMVPTQSFKLTTWGWSEQKARSFGQWLSHELGVEFKGIEEEAPECPVKG